MTYDHAGKASFAGITFDIVGADAGATLFADESNIAIEDLNYSDTTYIQVVGRKSATVTLNVVGTIAAINSLRGKIRQQGQLSVSAGESRTATMMTVSSPRSFPQGHATAQIAWVV